MTHPEFIKTKQKEEEKKSVNSIYQDNPYMNKSRPKSNAWWGDGDRL